MLFFAPALIGVHAYGHIAAAPQCLDYFFVVAYTHFHLHYTERPTFVDFLLHLCGVGLVADGVGRIGSVVGIKSPDFVPRLSHYFAQQIVQGNVYGGLCRTVVRSHRVHVCVYVLDTERVGELAEVKTRQESGHTLDAFSEVRRHRRLSITYQAVVLKPHLHARRRGALVLGKIESMAQFQFVGLKTEVEAAWTCGRTCRLAECGE